MANEAARESAVVRLPATDSAKRTQFVANSAARRKFAKRTHLARCATIFCHLPALRRRSPNLERTVTQSLLVSLTEEEMPDNDPKDTQAPDKWDARQAKWQAKWAGAAKK